MESKKKKQGYLHEEEKKKTLEKFYKQVVKNFGYEYQRRA
jgi:hypothetical protein